MAKKNLLDKVKDTFIKSPEKKGTDKSEKKGTDKVQALRERLHGKRAKARAGAKPKFLIISK